MIVQHLTAQQARYFIEPMIEGHYREVGNTQVYNLAPDWDGYEAIECSDRLVCLVAFLNGQAIGYSINFLAPHIHYKEQKVLYNDVLYVLPEFRDGTAGGRLMAETRKHRKRLGAVLVQWHAKPDTALDRVLSRRLPLFENCYQDLT